MCNTMWPMCSKTSHGRQCDGDKAAAYLLLNSFFNSLFEWTYAMVFVYLCAHSGGTRTMRNAVLITVCFTLTTTLIMWGEVLLIFPNPNPNGARSWL